MGRAELEGCDYVRIAAETLLTPRTVKRAYETGRVTPANIRRIEVAANALGLAPPGSAAARELVTARKATG